MRDNRAQLSVDAGADLPGGISVIIPTHSRPAALARCLDALAAQRYPSSGFQVLVVQDGGRDDLAEIVSRHADRTQITLVHQEQGGPASARNRGLRAASFSHVAFIDDDCVADPSWLAALSSQIEREPDHLLGGITTNALEENPFASASQALITYLYQYFNENTGVPRFFASNNIAASRDRLEELGGFDESYRYSAGEDRDLCDRWLARGWPMRFVPEAVVHHHSELDLRGFMRQHFRYGRGACRFRLTRARRTGRPLSFESLGFYSGIIATPFRDPAMTSRSATLGLLALAQGFHALGFLAERRDMGHRQR